MLQTWADTFISELNDNDNSSVDVIKNNKKGVSFQIPEHGRFRLELEYNTEYQLIFYKKGNQSKTIIINTEIPEKEINSSSNIPHFLMAVNLFAGKSDEENHVQHICYSPQNNCFKRVPTILDVEYVEKGISGHDSNIQSRENKAKLQEYKVF